MIFTGFVAMRRGVLDHPRMGYLSNNEFVVLLTLIMLADAATGSGTINAPSLRSYLPKLSYPAAKRILQSLEDKKYIYRQITPFSKVVYRYWVNNYEVSRGIHQRCRTDLSYVVANRDITCIRYRKPVPEGSPEPQPEGVRLLVPEAELVPVLNNNKDKENDKNVEKDILPLTERNASSSKPKPQPQAGRERTIPQATKLYMRFSQYDGSWIDTRNGRVIDFDQFNRRLAQIGMKMYEGVYSDLSTGAIIPRELAEGCIAEHQ